MFHVWCGGIFFLWSLLHLFLLPFPQCELLDPLGLLRRSTPMRPLHTIVTSPANSSIPWPSMEPQFGSSPTSGHPLHTCRLLDFLLLSLTSNLGIHFYFYSYRIFLFYLCLFLMREFWVFTIEIVSLRDAWGHAIFSIGGDIVTYCNKTHNFSFPLFACSSFPSPISALLQPDLFSDLILIQPDPWSDLHTHTKYFPIRHKHISSRYIDASVLSIYIYIYIYHYLTVEATQHQVTKYMFIYSRTNQ